MLIVIPECTEEDCATELVGISDVVGCQMRRCYSCVSGDRVDCIGCCTNGDFASCAVNDFAFELDVACFVFELDFTGCIACTADGADGLDLGFDFHFDT